MIILGEHMDGYKVDVDELDYAIHNTLEPWIDHSGEMWGKLQLLHNADEPRLAGHGRDTESGRALGMSCLAFASRYTITSDGLVDCMHTYFLALQTFRDTLQQVVDSYRTNELRHQDNFRRTLRDI